jgi:hypothetical protein
MAKLECGYEAWMFAPPLLSRPRMKRGESIRGVATV